MSMRTLSAILSSALLGAGLVAVSAPTADAVTTYSAPLRTAIHDLPTRAEVRTGYDRDKFKHWVDADGDGCDTRKEVLIAEVDAPLSIGSSCTLTGGRWYSYYDRRSWTDQGRIDIDHMVPLAEAWDSGARSWTAANRERFANDLGDFRSLVGVTDTVNQQKSDQDPAEWLPPYYKCRYLREYVAVKVRWRLSIDAAERVAMVDLAASCQNTTITVKRAI
jgi:hypothetical protein